jgi:hypothetical protein
MPQSATEKAVNAYCPRCGAMEMVEIVGHKLLPTRHWRQGFAGHVYHRNCHYPCRLFL